MKCARSAHERREKEGGKGEGHCIWVKVEGESSVMRHCTMMVDPGNPGRPVEPGEPGMSR
jgi:hypothetical protein